jgi:hypothetical protein
MQKSLFNSVQVICKFTRTFFSLQLVQNGTGEFVNGCGRGNTEVQVLCSSTQISTQLLQSYLLLVLQSTGNRNVCSQIRNWEDLEAEWTASSISENHVVEPLHAEDPVRFGTRSCNIVIVPVSSSQH